MCAVIQDARRLPGFDAEVLGRPDAPPVLLANDAVDLMPVVDAVVVVVRDGKTGRSEVQRLAALNAPNPFSEQDFGRARDPLPHRSAFAWRTGARG